MSEPTPAQLKCSKCGKPIEVCACCEKPDCEPAICYACLRVAVGQALPQPHAHGG
jgi:hypothetical protein